jgi:glycosyltransferase involved in cell wall biosynthesis
MTTEDNAVRVTRVIARLNVGGPAIQAITLTRLLEPYGYRTRLVRGRESPDEGSMDYLAGRYGVVPTLVSTMRRDPGPGDLAALCTLVRLLRRDRPRIVHTHAAKAGTLGRLAALVAFPSRTRRPVLVHTFHGHSLTGYFSPRSAAIFRRIERFLAARTDVLIAVSEQVRDELVSLGVADADHFTVVQLGFDLSAFVVDAGERSDRRDLLRRELGVPSDRQLVTLIARLVPIKRVDRFLRVAVDLAGRRPSVHFLVVGDGELREQLRMSPEASQLDGRLTWAGFRRDIPDVCFASDAVVLTSDNEGTPVSLIEARAAGTPVVATRVGGVASVVKDGDGGFVVEPEDEPGLALAIARVLDDQTVAAQAADGAAEVAQVFSLDGLAERLDGLYRRLLSPRAPGSGDVKRS